MPSNSFSNYGTGSGWDYNSNFAPNPVWICDAGYLGSVRQTLVQTFAISSATTEKSYQVVLTYGAFYFVSSSNFPATMSGGLIISDILGQSTLAQYRNAPSGLCAIDGKTYRMADYFTDDSGTIYETRETTRTYTATANGGQSSMQLQFLADSQEDAFWYVRNMKVYGVNPC